MTPTGATENYLRTNILPAPQVAERDLSALATPRITKAISVTDFFDFAKTHPALAARNSAQYMIDAFSTEKPLQGFHFGNQIAVYPTLSNPVSPIMGNCLRTPLDQEETIHKICGILSPQARIPIPNRGVLLYGEPGAGKDLLLGLLISKLLEYSKYHQDGVRFRVAIGSGDKSSMVMGMHQNGSAENHSNGHARNGSSPRYRQLEPGFMVASESNVTPFALLNHEYDLMLEAYGDPRLADQVTGRGALIRDMLQSADGRFVNTDYIRSAQLGPSLGTMHRSLVDFYMQKKEFDLPKALEIIRYEHVFAEPYRFNTATGEGILGRLPHLDRRSIASPITGRSDSVPGEFRANNAEQIVISSSFLKADFVIFEDMFLGSDGTPPAMLHSLIERGQLQFAAEHSADIYTVTGKDCLFLSSVNTDDIRARKGTAGFKPFMERWDSIFVPHIRNYRQQALALEGDLQALGDRKATPHALELAALFLVATRVLSPKESYYVDSFREAAPLVKRLGGVAKAIYLASTPQNQDFRKLNHFVEPQFKGEEIKKLGSPELLERVAHEYAGDVYQINDGGIGISVRAAHDFMSKIIHYNPFKDLTVRDVVECLKNWQTGFGYEKEFREAVKTIAQRKYEQLCHEEEVDYVEPDLIRGSALSSGEKQELIKIWNNALDYARAQFPITDPEKIIEQLERYAKGLIRQDVRDSLGITDAIVNPRFIQYFEHLKCYHNPNLQVDKEFLVQNIENYGDGRFTNGVDVDFMLTVEVELGMAELAESGRDQRKVRAKNEQRLETERLAIWDTLAKAVSRHNDELDSQGNKEPRNLKSIASHLIQFDPQVRDYVNRMVRHSQDRNQSKIDQFNRDIDRYLGQSDNLSADLKEPLRSDYAEAWRDAWAYLINKGYTEQVLPNLIRWSLGSPPQPENKKT